jgi:hypothetical protein
MNGIVILNGIFFYNMGIIWDMWIVNNNGRDILLQNEIFFSNQGEVICTKDGDRFPGLTKIIWVQPRSMESGEDPENQ